MNATDETVVQVTEDGSETRLATYEGGTDRSEPRCQPAPRETADDRKSRNARARTVAMSLEDLAETVETEYGAVEETTTVELDRETRHELAMLAAALDVDTDELVRRGVHMLFQSAVDTGKLDFHLRAEYDVTYDEYLSGMTFEEMSGGYQPADEQDRRYQF